MPRPKKPAGPGPNAIVASAARVTAGRKRNRPQQATGGWQAEAWKMLDTVGELEFYREWIANALSRCTLSVVEDLDDGDTKPVTQGLPADALAALFGGNAGQTEMLSSMGGHLAIPGETWLAGLVEPSEDPDIDTWRVLSADEVREQGSRWVIDRGDGVPEAYDDDQIYVTRIWQPHPRKGVEANSSVRSALPILRELVGLSQHVAAAIDSRLAGAGVLAVPSEITFSTPAGNGDAPDDPATDPFLVALVDAMVTAIEDRADASALAPVIVRAPAEHLDKIKHLTFATPLQAEARELRREAITRLAASLDVPAEVLLGMADVNHWTGWLLDESAIKMHVEPLLNTITHGLTTRYLWPVLQGDSPTFDPALRRFRIVGSTAALRQRPNRSGEAERLHGTLVITDSALARETGFSEDDLLDPSSEEYARRVLMTLARSGNTSVAAVALAALGVPLDLAALGSDAAAPERDSATPEAPETAGDPRDDRNLPDDPEAAPTGQEQAAAVLAVSEVLVHRAVERGWNRAGRRGRVRQPVEAAALDDALAGVWEQVPRAAHLTGVDPDTLTSVLDGYARRVLTTGAEVDPRALATVLVSRVLTPQRALGSRT